MRKEAQISIFIGMGLLLLLLATLTFYLLKIRPTLITLDEFEDVDYFLRECTTRIAVDGIYLLGAQGGYFQPPKNSEQYYTHKIPYYLYRDTEGIPALETIQEELEFYTTQNIAKCERELQEIYPSYSFLSGTPSASVKIRKQDILLKINPSLEVSKNTSTVKFTEFAQELEFDLQEKYEISKLIIAEQKSEPAATPLGFIIDLAAEREFQFDLIELSNTTHLYALYFNSTLGDGEKFTYNFLTYHD